MAKRGYKQGAMSATDAITQLRAAAAKCDNKWMKAHAASARFFGAREADVKHALKRCGTVKSSLMGAKPRKRNPGYTGDMRGLKGSSSQHATRAKAHFSAADEELEWAASPAARAYGGQKRILANASRQLTAGMVNCGWVRSKKAKQVCHAEEKRLIRKLAKLEGDDRVLTHNFALDGTRKRRRRKR